MLPLSGGSSRWRWRRSVRTRMRATAGSRRNGRARSSSSGVTMHRGCGACQLESPGSTTLANVWAVVQTGCRPTPPRCGDRPGDEARGTSVLRAFFVDRRDSGRSKLYVKPGNRVDEGRRAMEARCLDVAQSGRRQVDRPRVRRAHAYALVGLPLRHRRLAHMAETLCRPTTRGSSA